MCFWNKVGRGEWEGDLREKAVTFSHPDESIFQSSEFQFPPDYVRRALSVHEKSLCWRKRILDSFFPQNGYDIFHLWTVVTFLSCCVQLLLFVMYLCLFAFFSLLRWSLWYGLGAPCGKVLTCRLWRTVIYSINMCTMLIFHFARWEIRRNSRHNPCPHMSVTWAN